MSCPNTLPPAAVEVLVRFDFQAGKYVANLETPNGQLDLSQKGNGIPVCITIDPANQGLTFYSDPDHGYGVMFAEEDGQTKAPVYNARVGYKGNHQFGNSIRSDGDSIWFKYNNDETGGTGKCESKFARSDIGFIVSDSSGTYMTDPIIDNGSNQQFRHRVCSYAVRHHHHRHR